MSREVYRIYGLTQSELREKPEIRRALNSLNRHAKQQPELRALVLETVKLMDRLANTERGKLKIRKRNEDGRVTYVSMLKEMGLE